MKTVGSRAEVWHGTAKKTSGGLLKKDLKMNKRGRIVSKKMSNRAKKEKRLEKAGYKTKKGKFTLFKSKNKRGGNNALKTKLKKAPMKGGNPNKSLMRWDKEVDDWIITCGDDILRDWQTISYDIAKKGDEELYKPMISKYEEGIGKYDLKPNIDIWKLLVINNHVEKKLMPVRIKRMDSPPIVEMQAYHIATDETIARYNSTDFEIVHKESMKDAPLFKYTESVGMQKLEGPKTYYWIKQKSLHTHPYYVGLVQDLVNYRDELLKTPNNYGVARGFSGGQKSIKKKTTKRKSKK